MSLKIERDSRDDALDETQILFRLDLAGNFKSVDSAAGRAFGYTSDEICRMNLTHLVPPNYADYVREQIARALVADLGAVYELEIHTKDGECLACEVSTRLIMRNGCPFELEAIAFPRVDSWVTRAKCLDEEFWIGPGLDSARALTFI